MTNFVLKTVLAVVFVLFAAFSTARCCDTSPNGASIDPERKAKLLRLAGFIERLVGESRAAGNQQRTELLLKLAMKCYREVCGENDSRHIGCTEQLARHYAITGDFAKAARYFQEILNKKRAINESEEVSYFSTVQELANVLARSGRLRRAKESMRSVVEFFKSHFGTSDPRCILANMELGLLCSDLGNHEQGGQLFKVCLNASKARFGKNSVEYADCLHCIGMLSAKMGNLNEAKIKCQQALEIQTRKLTSDKYVTIQLRLCAINLSLGKNKEASRLLNEISKRQRAILANNEGEPAAHAHNLELLGICHGLEWNFKEAEFFYQKAIASNKTVRIYWHPRAVTCLEAYADILRRHGRTAEMKNLLAKIQLYRLRYTAQEIVDCAWYDCQK